MPCNSDYMNATDKERQISQVACLLDEIAGKSFSEADWNGYHPLVYGKTYNADKMVAKLCSRLKKLDVKKFSLEMQIWWRDHQKADKERLKLEKKAEENQKLAASALKKLTKAEKKALGF